jgi:hypothetical protein
MVGKFKGFDGRLEMPLRGCGENGEELCEGQAFKVDRLIAGKEAGSTK